MMFIGEYRHALDKQRRVAVPREWRTEGVAPSVFYLLPGRYHSIQMLPPEVFETDIVDRLSKVSFADADKARALARIGSKAARGICDKQGRITLTPELMAHAGLKEQVVLVGAIRTMQIMTPEAWEESHMSADEFLDQMQDIQERGEI